MKRIVFVALIAAAGCSKNKPSDCEVSIGKGMDAYAAKVRSVSPNPQGVEGRLAMIDKLRGVLTTRCTQDKWGPDVVLCFTTVESMRDIQTCQARLGDEQRTKLRMDVREAMMSMRGSMGMPGHPPMLTGSASGSGAPQPAQPAQPTPPPSGSGTPAAPTGSPAPAGSAAPPAGSAAPPPPAAGAPPPPAPTAGSGTPPATGGKLR
ncbi:MAG TPA: hypothetical protein VFK02_11790 [Kofleriaceae bacterium]|nr:hypothetical protein [Kofleriaceae bacterium]